MWNIILHFKAREKCPQNGCPENSGSFPHQGLSTPLNIIFPSLLGRRCHRLAPGAVPPKVVIFFSQHSYTAVLGELEPLNISLLRGLARSLRKRDWGQKLLSNLATLGSSANTKDQQKKRMVIRGLGRQHIQWRACPPSTKIWAQYPAPT